MRLTRASLLAVAICVSTVSAHAADRIYTGFMTAADIKWPGLLN